MGNDDILTDDYVAELLSKDAKDCSLKYSSMGLEAFQSTSKMPANMPRPNTRFLRNIIRDTDSHNKALLEKEAAESRARLQDLESAGESSRRRQTPDASDMRRRQVGNINAILGGRRRKDEASRDVPDQEQDGPSDRHRSHREGERKRHRHRDESPRRSRHHHTKHRDHTSRTRHKRDHSDHSDDDRDRRRRRHRRSRSPHTRRRSRSPRAHRPSRRTRSPLRHDEPRQEDGTLCPENDEPRQENDTCCPETDADPLDDFIGPAPPPKARGRGAIASLSGIDQRFAADYDPKSDVAVDDDAAAHDWDGALEALRDRQKWKKHQAERMRAAGFEDHVIHKIAQTDEKREEDVQWGKAGEMRAWDVGKDEEMADAWNDR